MEECRDRQRLQTKVVRWMGASLLFRYSGVYVRSFRAVGARAGGNAIGRDAVDELDRIWAWSVGRREHKGGRRTESLEVPRRAPTAAKSKKASIGRRNST